MIDPAKIRIFRLTSTVVVASRPTKERLNARRPWSPREWVVVTLRNGEWSGYESLDVALRNAEAITSSRWRRVSDVLHYATDNDPLDWAQVRKALGSTGTLNLAVSRGPGSLEAAVPFVPFAAAVNAAMVLKWTDLVHDLCAGRTKEELLPLLSSKHEEVRLAAQMALGVGGP